MVIAEETSHRQPALGGQHADHQRRDARSRQLTVIAIVDGGRGHRGRRRCRAAGVTRRRDRGRWSARAEQAAARRAARPRTPQPLGRRAIGPPGTADWDDAARPRPSIGVFADFAPALGEALRAAAAGGRELYGFAEHDVDDHLPRHLDRAAAAARPADRPRRADRASPPTWPRSAWAGAATRDFADVDVAALDAELARSGSAGPSAGSTCPPGATRRCCRPAAVADLMIYLYWSAGGPRRPTAGPSSASPAAAPGSASGCPPLPLTLSTDPRAPGPGVRAVRDRARVRARRRRCSTTGCRSSRTDWIRDGELAALLQTRHSARARPGSPVTPGDRQPDARGDGRRVGSRTMIAGTERGLLLTCLWYIREVDPQTLLLTGLTRDGVYLVENGEVVGRGEQLPVQREPGRPARPGRRGGRHRADACRASGATTSPGPRCRRCGSTDFNMSSVSQAS